MSERPAAVLERLLRRHLQGDVDPPASEDLVETLLQRAFMAGAQAVDQLYNRAIAADQYRGATTGNFQLIELSDCAARIADEIRDWHLSQKDHYGG